MAMESLRVAAKESKVMKFILGGFIFLAVGGLVFTDVGGYFTDGVGTNEVAQVGDTTITLQSFDRDLRATLQQVGIGYEEAYEAGYIEAYLESRINNLLQLKAAQDLNLDVDNKLIGQQIRRVFGDMPTEQIQMTLRARGISEQQMANSIRSGILNEYVTTLPLAVANYVPDFITTADNSLKKERRSGRIYSISLDDLSSDITVTDEDIQKYYDTHIEDYTTPERRTFKIGTLSLDKVKGSLPPLQESDLRAAYEDNIEDYNVAETRNIAQAVVNDPDQAQAIYEEAQNGTPLQTALKNITDNTKGYREAAPYQAEGLPESLADKAFDETISAGDVTPPVKTAFGYTIMKVTEITDARQKSFDEVKASLKEELEKTRLYDALYNKMIDVEDMIDNGDNFDTIATENGLSVVTSDSYTQDDLMTADGILRNILEASPAVEDELYSLPENSVTYPVEMAGDQFAVIGLETVTPATARPFNEVRDDIASTLTEERKENVAMQYLKNNIENDNIGFLENASANSYSDISRQSDNDYTDLIYSVEAGEYAYDIYDDNAIIVMVSDVSFSDSDVAESNRQDMIKYQSSILDSLLSQYYRDKIDVSINYDLLEQQYSGVSTQ